MYSNVTKAVSRTEPDGGGPDRPQQTTVYHAGAEGGPAGEKPAKGSAHGGSGGAPAVQEVRTGNIISAKDMTSVNELCSCVSIGYNEYNLNLLLCSGILPQAEPPMVEVDLEAPESAEHNSAKISDTKEERTTIGKL